MKTVECPKCYGKGRIRCQSCNGTGILKGQVHIYRPDDVLGKCTFCRGTGTLVCSRCNGRGVVCETDSYNSDPLPGSSGSSRSRHSKSHTNSDEMPGAIAVITFFIAWLAFKLSVIPALVVAAVAYGIVWFFTREAVKSTIQVIIGAVIFIIILALIFN